MCIVNRLSKKQVEEYKEGLPEEFVAYRCIDGDAPLYFNYQDGEPNSTKSGVHEAGNYSEKRSNIDYTPGFHVFKTEEGARKYRYWSSVVPVTICKSWIQEIGNCEILDWDTLAHKVLGNEDVFVCDYIKVE